MISEGFEAQEDLMQFSVLSFSVLQHGNVEVSVFPQGEEDLIWIAGLGGLLTLRRREQSPGAEGRTERLGLNSKAFAVVPKIKFSCFSTP
jgi:hypothetical protein